MLSKPYIYSPLVWQPFHYNIVTPGRVYNPTGQSVYNRKPVTAVTLARYCHRQPQASKWISRYSQSNNCAVVQGTVPRANPPATDHPRPLVCQQAPHCGNRSLVWQQFPAWCQYSPHHIHHGNSHHRDKLVTKRRAHHPCQLFTTELKGYISDQKLRCCILYPELQQSGHIHTRDGRSSTQ